MAMPKKQLGNLSVDEFIGTDVLEVNTFPYLPSGLLQKHAGGDPTASTDKLLQNHYNDWKEADRFVERFSEKQRNAMGWIMAGLIGVIGNLAVNLAFSSPVFGENLTLVILALTVVGLVIVAYLLFLPKVKMVFRFLPRFLDFPEGFEKNVDSTACQQNPRSRMILEYETLRETATDFAATVRLAIFKGALNDALKRTSCIRISSIKLSENFVPLVELEVSLKSARWLSPRTSNKLQSDMSVIAHAFLNAHQLCSVRAFELDPEEWRKHGAGFVNAVADWDFKAIQNMLIEAIKNEEG